MIKLAELYTYLSKITLFLLPVLKLYGADLNVN